MVGVRKSRLRLLPKETRKGGRCDSDEEGPLLCRVGDGQYLFQPSGPEQDVPWAADRCCHRRNTCCAYAADVQVPARSSRQLPRARTLLPRMEGLANTRWIS